MEQQIAVVFAEVARLADVELIAGLQRWVRAHRSLTARLLVHMGEVDARGLYRERAWPSMFAYAVGELRMSEAEAYVRIAAARLGRQFPFVIELIAQGALHLTAIKLLGPHLTSDNHRQVLERARGKSTREIDLIVAELAPKPDVPNRVRKLPAPALPRAESISAANSRKVNAAATSTFAAAAEPKAIASRAPMFPSAAQSENTATSGSISAGGPEPTASSEARIASAAQSEATTGASRFERREREQFQLEPAPRRVSSTTPLRPGRYKVEFTAGEGMHSKLEQLKALFRHQVPGGDLAIILERAADLLLAKIRKERFAQTTRQRASKAHASRARATEPAEQEAGASTARSREAGGSKGRASGARGVRPSQAHSRYIPRSVVREVYARDGEQCSFVSPDGKRCPERGFLERHHHDLPYARGGGSDHGESADHVPHAYCAVR